MAPHVRQKLTELVHKQAMEAGTSNRTITFETKDHAPIVATGDPLFVKRTIFATLKGRPDLLIDKEFSPRGTRRARSNKLQST